MVYKIFQFWRVLSICYQIFKPEYLHKRNACFWRQRTLLYCFSPCRNIDICLRTKTRYMAFWGHLQGFLFLENRAGAWEKIQAWNCGYYLNNKKAQKEFTKFFTLKIILRFNKENLSIKKRRFSASLIFCFCVSAFRFCIRWTAYRTEQTRSAVRYKWRKRTSGQIQKTSQTWLFTLLYRNYHVVRLVKRAVRVESHGISFCGIQFVTDFPDVTIRGFDNGNGLVVGFVCGNHICGISAGCGDCCQQNCNGNL